MTSRNKETPINLRANQRQRDLIDLAAQLISLSRTDFMLNAACEKAQEVLLDQRLFIVDDQQFAEFQRILDTPLSENKGFQELMSDKYSW